MQRTDHRAPGWSRRRVASAAGGLAALVGAPALAARKNDSAFFIAEAQRMKALAVARGDQAYGAVVVMDGVIVGYGPSRVVIDNNIDAHAERVALWDAQKRLRRTDLTGAVIYSTSHPCAICEAALAAAHVGRMFHGPDGRDGGRPGAAP